MTDYVIRRLLQAIVSIVFIIIATFLLTHALGDPVRLMLPPHASEEVINAMRERFGLNDPILVQLGRFLMNVVRGDFGTSLWWGEPAIGLVLYRLPRTVMLALTATFLATFGGILLGVVSALKPRSVIDRVASFITILGVSSIEFWLGLMFILVVAIHLRWLPTSGYGPEYLILPALTLAFRPMGRIAQVTRPAVMEELNKPYILALRAKGLSEAKVIWHAMHNAGIVVLTLSGFEFARLFTGSTVVVEAIFGWPGIGALMIEGINALDWPVTVAVVIVAATLVITLHLLIDLVYGWLDPRVRLH
ncbi:ABC transporter permease [Chloroflexota bacterium]